MSTNKANNPMDIPGGHGSGQPPGGGGGRRGPENPLRDPDTFMDTLAGMTAQYLEHQRMREEREGRLAGLTPEQIQQQQRIQQEVEQNRAIGFTLNPDEMEQIITSPASARQVVEGWLSAMEANEQFFTSEGANHILENKVNISIAWLIYLKYGEENLSEEGVNDTEKLRIQKKKQDIHLEKREIMEDAMVRMDLHNIKRAIGQADLKLIGEFATKIGMHGLMRGFDTKHARLAFNMYQRYFERHLYNYGTFTKKEKDGGGEEERLKGVFKDRISPQLINNEIRREVKADLIKNRELYGLTEEEALIAERIGYSLFSASQRKGVHVSRGTLIKDRDFVTEPDLNDPENPQPTYHNWYKTPGFTSDPDEILDNLYNPLEFQLRKWSRPSKAQTKVLNEIMTFMGEGDLVAGEQRFIDSSALSDLFSSGWRIEYIIESIERRAAAYQLSGEGSESDEQLKSRVESIATGMRLKAVTGSHDINNKKKVQAQLANVARYRPMELLKTYVVDIDRYAHEFKTKNPQREKLKAKLKQMFEDGEFKTSSGQIIHHYVELEDVLGRYIYPIYERGLQGNWNTMRGIDIGNVGHSNSRFDNEDKGIIDQVIVHVNGLIDASGDQRAINQKLTSANDLINLYKMVQDFVGSEEAINDMFEGRKLHHSQLFVRTLYLDDVPLDRLARTEKLKNGKEDLMLAGKFNDVRGGGRDSYRRIWNDTSAAFESNSEFMKAIQSTKTEQLFESLMKGSQAMSGYGGKEPALELAYNVAGGWLKLAMGDPIWRSLSLHDKLPIKTSELERLFGEGAASLSKEEAYHLVENLKLIFGDMTKDDPRITHAFHRAEKELGLKPWQLWLSRIYIIMLLLSLTAIGKLTEEIAEATKED